MNSLICGIITIDLLRNNSLLQFPYFGQIFQKFSWLSDS